MDDLFEALLVDSGSAPLAVGRDVREGEVPAAALGLGHWQRRVLSRRRGWWLSSVALGRAVNDV